MYSTEDGTYESRHRDKAAATWEAQQLAQEDPPSQVVIHASDDAVQRVVHYSATGEEVGAAKAQAPRSKGLEPEP